jgi:hypothetical protein
MEVSSHLDAPAALSPGKDPPRAHSIGRWVGPRPGNPAWATSAVRYLAVTCYIVRNQSDMYLHEWKREVVTLPPTPRGDESEVPQSCRRASRSKAVSTLNWFEWNSKTWLPVSGFIRSQAVNHVKYMVWLWSFRNYFITCLKGTVIKPCLCMF